MKRAHRWKDNTLERSRRTGKGKCVREKKEFPYKGWAGHINGQGSKITAQRKETESIEREGQLKR